MVVQVDKLVDVDLVVHDLLLGLLFLCEGAHVPDAIIVEPDREFGSISVLLDILKLYVVAFDGHLVCDGVRVLQVVLSDVVQVSVDL